MIDIGIVVIAVEILGTLTVSKNCYRQTGVRIAGEINAGFVVENVGDGDGEGVVAAV